MPFSFFPFKRRKQPLKPINPAVRPPAPVAPPRETRVMRHFYNGRGSQTYASFFPYWDGIITAGHVMTDTNDSFPPFATGGLTAWPDGLDAALIGCHVPRECPPEPTPGQNLICLGYPAGSRHMETRKARVYLKRPGAAGTWIAHILDPDEPVVTGMSGGPVLDAKTEIPIGIIVTRNSPADLNNDRDPDESLDFIALADVWKAVRQQQTFV